MLDPETLRKALHKHKREISVYAIILLVLLILAYAFFSVVKMVGFVLCMAFLNCILRFYRRILPGLPFELELTVFSTVIASAVFGIWAGLFVALLASISAEFFNQYISPHFLINIVVYALIPFASFFLTLDTITTGGLMITIGANILIFLLFHFVFGYDPFKNTLYSATNIIFNYVLFTSLAVPVMQMLA